LDLSLPVFKEVEKDPRCCSCNQKDGSTLADFPRFKETEKKPEHVENLV
jgi:hypothetical protein